MHSPAELATQFRSMGRKLTPQRQLIFSLLHNNETHPTAENLYGIASAQMPGISLRTVYQTLNELAEMGELQLIDLGEGGMRFDPNVDDHHHAVCSSCGKIRDVHVKKERLHGASSKFLFGRFPVFLHFLLLLLGQGLHQL